jgi:Ni2+-binding GTPase involved in maturation of urease and hydrogenase
VSWGVKYLRHRGSADPAAEARRDEYIRTDLAMFAEDIRNERPDILLIESKDLELWARGKAALSDIFATYVLTATAGEVEIWQPKT